MPFMENDPTGTISYNISCNGLSDDAIVNLEGEHLLLLIIGLLEEIIQMENNIVWHYILLRLLI